MSMQWLAPYVWVLMPRNHEGSHKVQRCPNSNEALFLHFLGPLSLDAQCRACLMFLLLGSRVLWMAHRPHMVSFKVHACCTYLYTALKRCTGQVMVAESLSAKSQWPNLAQAWLPDSPRWLLLNGDSREKAEAALIRARGKYGNDLERIRIEIAAIARSVEEAQADENPGERFAVSCLRCGITGGCEFEYVIRIYKPYKPLIQTPNPK